MSARASAVSVLPTPDGPASMKTPIGLFGLPLREAFYKFQFLCSRAFEEAIFEGIATKKEYRIKFIGNDFDLLCDLNSLMDNRTIHMARLFNLPAFRFLKLEELECLITQKEILAS